MAERTSTRNRRNTPQSPPRSYQIGGVHQQSPARRTTRATRSQSREVSDSDTGNAGPRAGRRSARQASVQGPQAVSFEGTAQGRKGKVNAHLNVAQVDPELSMVAEESNIEYPVLAQNASAQLESAANAIQETNQSIKSPGNLSAFSGTTARTSNAVQELRNSNAQDMLDALPDLSDAADKLLRWLLPQDMSENTITIMRADLQYPGSRISKNVKRLSDVFQAQKGIYGDFESYINIPAVLKTLLGSDNVTNLDAAWRPEPLLHKANIATFVGIIIRSWGEKFNNEHFDFLETIFPVPFLSRSSRIEDLSVAVEIRTQHFIMLSSRYTDVPNFDPDMFLSQVFFNEPPVLKGWEVSGLRSEDLTKEQQALIRRRLQEIRRNFSNGRAVDLPSLKIAFPWNVFVTKVVAWSKARLDQIQNEVDAHGGAVGIVQALSNETQTSVSAGRADMNEDGTSPLVDLGLRNYPSPSQFSHTTSDQSELHRLATMGAASMRPEKVKFDSPRAMLVGIKALRELEERHAIQNNPMAQSVAPVAVMSANLNNHSVGLQANVMANATEGFMSGGLGADDWQPPQIDDDPMSMDDNTRALAAAIVQHGQQRERAQNKENIADIANQQYGLTAQGSLQRQALGPRQYIDPQPGAQRVEWSESGFSQDVRSSSRGIKRNYAAVTVEDDVEPDPSQDEGFQQDNRNQDIAGKRRSKPQAAARVPSQLQQPAKRARMTEGEDEDGNHDVDAAVDDYNNAGDPPDSTLGAYQSSKTRALAMTASQPKKVQVRKAWTDDETGTLLDLIEEHGTSWRLLKEIDDNGHSILRGRDQVALKDKARNMKLDFLKAQADLPSNFEFVPLNKIQIQKLHDLGIDYNQDRGRRSTAA